jgi:hypothetical protein
MAVSSVSLMGEACSRGSAGLKVIGVSERGSPAEEAEDADEALMGEC